MLILKIKKNILKYFYFKNTFIKLAANIKHISLLLI
jgi:hypothetical protein